MFATENETPLTRKCPKCHIHFNLMDPLKTHMQVSWWWLYPLISLWKMWGFFFKLQKSKSLACWVDILLLACFRAAAQTYWTQFSLQPRRQTELRCQCEFMKRSEGRSSCWCPSFTTGNARVISLLPGNRSPTRRSSATVVWKSSRTTLGTVVCAVSGICDEQRMCVFQEYFWKLFMEENCTMKNRKYINKL